MYRSVKFQTLLWTGIVLGLVSSQRLAKGELLPDSDKKSGKGSSAFGKPQRLSEIGTREPSGIVYHPRLGHLFIVGDEGLLVEMDKMGKVVRTQNIAGNLEDITVHTPTGRLMLISESVSELIDYDPVKKAERRRWALDMAAILGEDAKGHHGFEGLGFREDGALPGGGVFYLARQTAPTMIVGFAFDPESTPAGTLRPRIVSRWRLGEASLRSAFFLRSIERFLVLSNKGLTLVDLAGTAKTTLALEGTGPEGVCVDDEGAMWVADDEGRAILKFPGAIETLKRLSEGQGKGKAAKKPTAQ